MFGEINITKKHAAIFCIFIPLTLFTGCSSKNKASLSILRGRIDWERKDHHYSAADYLSCIQEVSSSGTEEAENIKQYALLGLATTYLVQNENDAALGRFSEISLDAPKEVQFAKLYNSGIIANRQGDYVLAIRCFRQALEIDSGNQNAKINLELSQQELKASSTRSNAQEEIVSVEENEEVKALESAIYSKLRENEKNKWKSQSQTTESSPLDY